MIPDPLPDLQRLFGFPDFRGVQRQVIDRVLARERTLAVMPTGAGKSLCYQLPATMLDGTCVVVSPLIALMHDQLRAAEAVGIRAATLTSVDDNRAETIAPLPRRRARPAVRRARAGLVRASSGTCWPGAGSACSRSTRRIASASGGTTSAPTIACSRRCWMRSGDVPRLALTATADAHTRADILAQLGIPVDGLIVSGFDRPNIRYLVSPRDNTARQIADVIRRTPGAGHRLCAEPRRHRAAGGADRSPPPAGRRAPITPGSIPPCARATRRRS